MFSKHFIAYLTFKWLLSFMNRKKLHSSDANPTFTVFFKPELRSAHTSTAAILKYTYTIANFDRTHDPSRKSFKLRAC